MSAVNSPRDARRSSDRQPPSRWARGVRAALLLVIVAAGCYVSYGLGRLWAEWRQATPPSEALAASPFDPNMLAPALPLDGPWSFANLDWNIRSRLVAHGDVASRLEKLADMPHGASDEHLPDVSQELVELAASLRVKPVERDGNLVYRVERPDMMAQMVVRDVAGTRKAVALTMAFPVGGEQWQLFELTPAAAGGSFSAAEQHLLPLPAGAERSGGRFADDGRPLLELISLESSEGELFTTWKDAGWEVRPSGLGDPAAFSYLCVRGGDVIYAWSADPGNSLRNLMLVRTPTSSDTNAEQP